MNEQVPIKLGWQDLWWLLLIAGFVVVLSYIFFRILTCTPDPFEGGVCHNYFIGWT